MLLNGERSAAAAGSAGIRVFKAKAPAVQAALPVYFHTVQVHFMRTFHNKGNVAKGISRIGFFLRIKAQHIRHSGAAAALYSNTQAVGRIKRRRLHQPLDFGNCARCKTYGRLNHCFHTAKIPQSRL